MSMKITIREYLTLKSRITELEKAVAVAQEKE